MPDYKTIDVTPNVKRCLEILKEIVESLPPGDLKDKGEGTIDYLSRTFDGEPQPLRGAKCPPERFLIPS